MKRVSVNTADGPLTSFARLPAPSGRSTEQSSGLFAVRRHASDSEQAVLRYFGVTFAMISSALLFGTSS